MSLHGITAVAWHFSRNLDQEVRKSTVTSIKKAYLEGVGDKRAGKGDRDLALLPQKKRGRQVLLGDDLDL